MNRVILVMLLLATLSLTWAVPREMVVLEIGTGTWCPYCPGASMGAHDLIEAGYNVAVIKNHNGDPYANTYSNTRNSYYGITSFPTALFDGLNAVSGGSNTNSMFNSYLPRVTSRLAVPSKYTITAEGALDNGILTVDVTVSKPEADTNTGVYLRSALTESNIAQNWQGQTRLDNVLRLMAPNTTGTLITLGTGESTTVTLTFDLNSAWQLPNLELVLFLQNNTSKEILQGKKYSVPGLSGAFPASTDNLVFPDTYVSGISTMPITFYNFGDNAVTGTVSSSNPAFIPEVANISIPALQSAIVNVHFAPDSAGDVSGTLSVNGNFNGYAVLEIALNAYAFVNAAPIAEDVMISGPPVLYQDITGTYTYSDPDGDSEGSSQYQWYRQINGVNQAINNANEITYRIQMDDYDLHLVFGVTPLDEHGMPGTTVFSSPTEPIVGLPIPQSFEGELIPPNTVVLTWQKPMHFDTRGFVGYRIYRNDLLISTITNVNTLTFTDINLLDGEYEYKIASIFTNPSMTSAFSPSVFITVNSTSTDDLVNIAQSSVTVMPNPFGADTSFRINAKANQEIRLSVFNLKGQQVKSWNAIADAQGNAMLNWDGRDHRGNQTDSGMYLYKMEADGKTINGKIIRVKK
jgi:hypothetical protein